MKRILFIEDDANVREPLAALLSREGFEVVASASLKQAEVFLREGVDLVLLDWNLPDGEGLDWLVGKRKAGFSKPVIMLTARTDLVDRVVGLEFGANDYITKPFESRELLARIRVQLRTPNENRAIGSVLAYGKLKIDLGSQEAEFDGRAIHLTPTELDLLKLLLSKPGQVYTREEILEAVWGHESGAETRALDNCVLQLRKKLESDFIITVRGLGYKVRVDR